MDNPTSIKGRGSAGNPANRFEKLHLERDENWDPAEDSAPATHFLKDTTSKIVTFNDSPDVGFEASINIYRGCEHGCIYCFARPTHEYLGFSAGLDFETRIMVKENAPELLRKELSSPRWKPQVVAMSTVTDCYQPIERKLKLARGCLEVFAEFRNPVGIITKNHLVTRDIDLLSELAKDNAAAVNISVTTLDASLTPKLEPRASLPNHRLAAIEALSQAGVPVGVLVAPVIPGLTDHEMPAIIAAAVKAGARWAGYVPVRLPFAVKDCFKTGWAGISRSERRRCSITFGPSAAAGSMIRTLARGCEAKGFWRINWKLCLRWRAGRPVCRRVVLNFPLPLFAFPLQHPRKCKKCFHFRGKPAEGGYEHPSSRRPLLIDRTGEVLPLCGRLCYRGSPGSEVQKKYARAGKGFAECENVEALKR